MKSGDLSEQKYDAQRALQRKRRDEKGLREPKHRRDAEALAAGAGEVSDRDPTPIPADQVTEPDPTRIGER